MFMTHYDLVVVGGGFAGVGAAIAAARKGLNALLIEKINCLGGAAANNLVMPFMPNSTRLKDNKEYILSQGIFEEIVNEVRDFGKTFFHSESYGEEERYGFQEEFLKLILNRKVISSGVSVLFDSSVVSVDCAENRVNSIEVFGKGKRYTLTADYFIDATGDANLTAMAGFPFRLGRESDHLCQPMTLCFRVANVDVESFWKLHMRGEINKKYRQMKAIGQITNPRDNILVFKTLQNGVLHFNTTRIIKLNPTDVFDVTKAEIQAREQVFELLSFLRENFECCRNCELISTAIEIGTRESRMIDGEYTVTGTELKDCPKYADSVALGNYDIDIHNPEGGDTSHYYFPAGKYYELPYRILIPKNSVNLLVAGRCVSADHEAQASIRIMPITCCLGEAAGTAVGIAFEEKCSVKEIDVHRLQEVLVDNGAVIN